MTTTKSTHLVAANETDDATACVYAELSRTEIEAIAARAASVRAVERGRLLRAAWLAFAKLWRKPCVSLVEKAGSEVMSPSR